MSSLPPENMNFLNAGKAAFSNMSGSAKSIQEGQNGNTLTKWG
jgi:hypothetical protein